MNEIYDEYIGVYSVLTGCAVVAAGLLSIAAVISTLLAARSMHYRMCRTLIRSPIRFKWCIIILIYHKKMGINLVLFYLCYEAFYGVFRYQAVQKGNQHGGQEYQDH